ncbi:Zinc transporter ZIP1 [Trichinella papuae]|uniref:Zinc transporter ZIP1 n=1 Tax=Trichinella papuae TaxID=268474 RepID=A0A0V1M4E8_9BILA|nr:Zinc transporter ZIP1 [Trichinella papuae]
MILKIYSLKLSIHSYMQLCIPTGWLDNYFYHVPPNCFIVSLYSLINMELWILKMLLLLLMTIITMFFGSLPVLMVACVDKKWFNYNHKWQSTIICAVTCASGGIFFGTCFLHLMPEAREAFEFIAKDFNFPEIPLSEIVACIGFFFIFLLEEVTVICVGKKNSTDKVENCSSIKDSRNGAGIERAESVLDQPDHQMQKYSTASRDRAVDHIHWIRSFTLLMSITFHSVLEGLSIGIQTKETSTVALFIAVISHKILIAFSLGLQFIRTHRNNKKFVFFCVFFFSIASPAGIGIGIGIETAEIDEKLKFLLFMIFSSLSVGTFLYITFFEIIIHELENDQSNLLKIISMMVGCVLIGILLTMTPHAEHWHDDGSDNNATLLVT